MREIKFRVWDIKNKTFNLDKHWFPVYIDLEGNLVCDGTYGISYFEEHEKFEICQYTGLKDKNGKEIYEGDILDTGSYKLDISSDFCENCSCCAKIYGYYLEDIRIDRETNKVFAEIIGNIYENPELLNE